MASHIIYEALPGQDRGREIARTELWFDASCIAQLMSSKFEELTYTIENGIKPKILKYRAGEVVELIIPDEPPTTHETQGIDGSLTIPCDAPGCPLLQPGGNPHTGAHLSSNKR